jgi:hypothetical protein
MGKHASDGSETSEGSEAKEGGDGVLANVFTEPQTCSKEVSENIEIYKPLSHPLNIFIF